MRLKCLVIIGLMIGLCNGQTEVLDFKIDTKNTRSTKTTYSLIDSKKDNIAFLILDRKVIHANLFDDMFKPLSTLSFEAPKKKFYDPLGYAVTNNIYYLLYTNKNFSKTLVVSVDFDAKKTITNNLDFKLEKNELYIDTVIYENDLLFITNKEDLIIIRKLLNGNELKEVKTFPIEQNGGNGINLNPEISLLDFFRDQIESSNTTKIDHRIPTSIEQASSPNKLFRFDNTLVFTVEIEDKGTIIYNIDLNTFEVKQNSYEYPKGKIDDYKKFNSFVYEDRLFQIACSRKEMSFLIKDLDNNILKEFYITKDKPITFKNGAIIQEGHTVLPFQNTRKLEATSKFLRKISSADVGVSVLKVNNLYEITLGGFKLVARGGGFGVGLPTTSTTFNPSTNSFETIFNPTFYNYETYTSTKATFFDTVLTEIFEPVKKEFEQGLNNKIDAYMGDYRGITGEDIFFYDKTPYYTYFNSKEKQFNLVKF